jgi:hypothetical protein
VVAFGWSGVVSSHRIWHNRKLLLLLLLDLQQ